MKFTKKDTESTFLVSEGIALVRIGNAKLASSREKRTPGLELSLHVLDSPDESNVDKVVNYQTVWLTEGNKWKVAQFIEAAVLGRPLAEGEEVEFDEQNPDEVAELIGQQMTVCFSQRLIPGREDRVNDIVKFGPERRVYYPADQYQELVEAEDARKQAVANTPF